MQISSHHFTVHDFLEVKFPYKDMFLKNLIYKIIDAFSQTFVSFPTLHRF